MVRILPYVGREAETWNDASMRKVVKVICYLSKHFVCVQVSCEEQRCEKSICDSDVFDHCVTCNLV